MTAETAIILTLVAYKVVLVGVGVWARGRSLEVADFHLAGRRMGPVVASLSASASSSSSWTLLGVSGFAFAKGVSALWLFPACVGGFLFNWWVLAPRLRRYGRTMRALTLTELLAAPARGRMRTAIVVAASLVILVSFGAYVAFQFQAAGKAFDEVFESTLDLGMTECVLLGAGVVTLYTLLGGFWAVSVTDTLQGMVMAASAVLVPLAALVAVGGPQGLAEGLSRIEVPGYLSPVAGLGAAVSLGFVMGLLGIGFGYPGQPHVVNRFMALREGDRDMVLARRVAVGWAVLVYAGMILLGLCGRLLVEDLGDQEKVLVAAARLLFHPVVAGVILAAVLSAIMSTADSQLLVAASTVTNDLGLGRRGKTTPVWLVRMVIVVLAAAAAFMALVVEKDIFNNVLFAWSVLGNAFGPLLLVTVLRRPPDPRWALAAIITGAAVSATAYILRPEAAGGAGPRYAFELVERLGGFTAALLLALAGSRRHLTRSTRPDSWS